MQYAGRVVPRHSLLKYSCLLVFSAHGRRQVSMSNVGLVCGDVEGSFSQLFSRVSAVQKKNGPFEMLLCVGNVFGENKDELEQYLNGSATVPIHTFILGPNTVNATGQYSSDKGAELCANLTYLGKKGVFLAGSGLTIVYLSGVERTTTNGTTVENAYSFTSKDVEELQAQVVGERNFKGVDILLTSCWPRDVTNYAGCPDDGQKPRDPGSVLVSRLAAAVKPRYHFCALADVHYERLPYRNHRVLAQAAQHATRFIALARVGNPMKKKWLYAFTILPLDKMDRTELVKQPADVTECPYSLEVLLSGDPDSKVELPEQFFYDMSNSEGGREHKRGRREYGATRGRNNKRPKTQLPSLASCWFCLSSSQVEKHLVVSVGDHNYLALPKGGLVPDHVLILPIGHCQAAVGLDDEALSEMQSFKTALCKLFRSQQQTPVFFERNYKSHHLQIQVVPVPLEKADKIKGAFLDIAGAQNITLDEIPTHSNLSQIVHVGAPYFYVELASGEKLLHRIHRHFPLQFGREVLASSALLNMPDKVDWRTCVVGREQENFFAAEFRKVFAPFDFTL